MYNVDKLALFLAEYCITGSDIVKIDNTDIGAVLTTADIKVEPVWDEPTEDTVLKVIYKSMERWFNTAEEVIYWLKGRADAPTNKITLLDMI
ncbi:TPA: hypothetical protein KOX39_003427 [Clostridioides difficile]|nr:hypothetical protein [Clostridioides difficile]